MSARSFNITKTTKQSNIQVMHHEGEIHVQLHRTIVFSLKLNGDIVLNSGGWQTVTTKTAINRAFSQLKINAGVSQVKGQWYVTFNGMKYDFKDNMVLKRYEIERTVNAIFNELACV